MPFLSSKQFAGGLAAMAALLVGVGWSLSGKASSVSFQCTVASITDGDTLRCIERDSGGRSIRVRLSGIDAREADGTCAVGHPCASASPEAATAALDRLASGQRLRCEAVGTSYKRVAAFCRNEAGTDLSCALLASGTVAKWPRYWGAHRC